LLETKRRNKFGATMSRARITFAPDQRQLQPQQLSTRRRL
jgi:hypothetical protein